MTLEAKLHGETGLIVTRFIPAPPARVFAAHVEPALLRQWMIGPPGSELILCEHDVRPGGAIRMRWRGEDFPEFDVTGEYIALDPPNRIEHVERMHMPEMTTEDNHVVTTFTAQEAGTWMEMVMTFKSAAGREAALSTGMTEGMEACYVLLDTVDLSG